MRCILNQKYNMKYIIIEVKFAISNYFHGNRCLNICCRRKETISVSN